MNPPGFWVGRIFPLSMLPQLWHKRKHKIMSGANQLTIDNEQLTIMVSLRDVNSIYWEFRKILRAAPHNGARRFGQCFDPSESMENAGILDVFPIFHTARLGQKIRRSPQLPLCGVALYLQSVLELWTDSGAGQGGGKAARKSAMTGSLHFPSLQLVKKVPRRERWRCIAPCGEENEGFSAGPISPRKTCAG